MPSWIVHRVCRYVLYVATTFCLSVHHSYFNGAERRARIYGPDMGQRSQELGWDIQMSCMRFHSLPSAGVIPVDNTFQSPQASWRHWCPKEIWKGRGHAVGGAPTLSACKNAPCIHILMAPKFCHSSSLSEITSCIPGLGAGDPSDLNK